MIISQVQNPEAIRSFLQRAEVRLSTMHRIAGVFLNGAGLLVVFPLFFTGAFERAFLDIGATVSVLFSSAKPLLFKLLFTPLAVPVFMSLFLPLYSLYLLFQDLVQFYFVGHAPGYNNIPDNFYPRFALNSLSFPMAESPDDKREVLSRLYSAEFVGFLIPKNPQGRGFFERVYRDEEVREKILPQSRRLSNGTILPPDVVDKLLNDEKHPHVTEEKLFHLALGQAGVHDFDLLNEAAKVEASLARHNLFLRRLVFRYAKALLLLIGTFLVYGLMLITLTISVGEKVDGIEKVAIAYWVFALFYLAWSILSPRLVRLPVDWVFQLSSFDTDKERNRRKDPQLVSFENHVKLWCRLSAICSAVVLIGGIIATIAPLQ